MKQLLGLAIVLVAICCAGGFVVDYEDMPIGELVSRDFSADPDPRCHGETKIIPIIDDCTHYLVCVNGRSRVHECYGGFHFDRFKHCVRPERAECWRTGVPQTAPPFDCPKDYGYFVHPTDCTKFVVCHGGRPEEKQCPENHTYRAFSGCVPAPCVDVSEYSSRAAEYTARIRPDSI